MASHTSASQVTLSLDPQLLRRVAEAASSDGVDVAAWIVAVTRRAVQVHEGRSVTGASSARNGGLTPAELVAARRRISARAELDGDDRPQHR